ncbi:hypothetical protein BH10BAC3_BH10BAC3_09380 [soil metagenome]
MKFWHTFLALMPTGNHFFEKVLQLLQFKYLIMFYSSKWKSGFFTGLITGIAIYSLAKTPRGRMILSKFQGVADIVKDQVNSMARQANDVLDTTAQVASNISRQEASHIAGETYTPGGTYTAGEAYAPGRN